MKGRGNYLCLHRFEQACTTTGGATTRSAWLIDVDRALGAADADRRPRRDRRICPRNCRSGAASRRPRRTASGDCPRFDGLLRHADAPGRGRSRRGHRQSPPAVRGRGSAPALVRRGHPRMPGGDRRRGASARGRRDAVLRRRGQQLPHRASSFTRCAAVRTSPLSCRAGCAGRGARHRGPGDDVARASSSTCRRRRPGSAVGRPRRDAVRRAPPRRQARRCRCRRRERAASHRRHSTALEEALALLKDAPRGSARHRRARRRDPRRRAVPAAGERRATSTSSRFAGAARHAAGLADRRLAHHPRRLDRPPAALVLTSATLSIGGSFGYVRARLGIGEASRSARAVGVRLPDAGDWSTCRGRCRIRDAGYAAAFAERQRDC